MQDIKQELKQRNEELCLKKLRKCRNKYKQLKLRDAAVEHQRQKISTLLVTLSDEKKRGDIDEKHLKRTVFAKERFCSKVNYYARNKVKAANTELYSRLNDIQIEFDSIVNDLKQSMKNKDSEYEALLMENEELIEAQTNETVSTFDSEDSIRQCCIKPLSLKLMLVFVMLST